MFYVVYILFSKVVNWQGPCHQIKFSKNCFVEQQNHIKIAADSIRSSRFFYRLCEVQHLSHTLLTAYAVFNHCYLSILCNGEVHHAPNFKHLGKSYMVIHNGNNYKSTIFDKYSYNSLYIGNQSVSKRIGTNESNSTHFRYYFANYLFT
jgi:hypothetical protein